MSRKKPYLSEVGMDKRQRRRFFRRNDLKHCDCWSPYIFGNRVSHFSDCAVVARRLGWW